jgi:hypothetical protein
MKKLILLALGRVLPWQPNPVAHFLAARLLAALPPGPTTKSIINSKWIGLKDDCRNERLSRREYEARKSQIEHGSIIY